MFLTALIRPLRGFRFRLTLTYALTFGVFICLFSFLLTKQFFSSIQEDFDSALLNYSIDLSRKLEIDSSGHLINIIPKKDEQKKRSPFSEETTYYLILDLAGNILSKGGGDFENRPVPPFDKPISGPKSSTHWFSETKNGNDNYRSVNVRLRNSKEQEFILQVTAPSLALEEQKDRIILLNLLMIPVFIIISSVVSFLLAGRAMMPIRVVTETVNNIAAKNLSLRLPEFQSGDEFQNLSVTFNGLLERLQKSFEAQEHFVANASHQLNTPLAIIKGELDVLESKPRTIEEHQKFNRSLREEMERMIELVKNLLVIARIEAGKEDSFRVRPFRLDDILISTMSRMKAKARDKEIAIRFNMDEDLDIDDLVIAGERQLIGSMFENLLDNAIKYSPGRSTINLDIVKGGGLKVLVKDEGPGIKPSELKNILEKRFRRGEMTLMPGTGIGLSIANKIAEHHKASISYEKLQPQGSLFTVHFAKQNLQ